MCMYMYQCTLVVTLVQCAATATHTHAHSVTHSYTNAHAFIRHTNTSQWTTDLDLITAVQEAGLRDVMCIKFYENRANGQSKG